MIASNVIHRVFMIKYGNSSGTAFTLDVAGKQYLITARHIVQELQDDENIEIFSNGSWAQLGVRLVGHGRGEADISVLATNEALTPAGLPMEATSKGVIYGQDVYFLGFPYGFLGKYILGPHGYPLPFVKKATVSLFDEAIFLLDGHNNPGFSGGPVVFTEPKKSEFKVAAVISSYRAVSEPIFAGNEATPRVYRYNTGIIVAHMIDEAIVLIEQKPVGYKVICAA